MPASSSAPLTQPPSPPPSPPPPSLGPVSTAGPASASLPPPSGASSSPTNRAQALATAPDASATTTEQTVRKRTTRTPILARSGQPEAGPRGGRLMPVTIFNYVVF